VFSVLLPEVRLGPLDAFWIGSILVIVFTGAYTILGGLRAVVFADAMQTVVLILGSLLVTFFGLQAIGGWSELRAMVDSEMFNLWKPLVPEGMTATWAPVKEPDRMAWYFNDNYPWLSMLFCAPVIGLWYWCTDQYIVQRALATPNQTQARRGAIFAGLLKLLPVFVFIIPGIIAFALASSGRIEGLQAGADRTGRRGDPRRGSESIPDAGGPSCRWESADWWWPACWLRLMSSLSSTFNASATLFTMDFYSKLYPNVSQHRLVWIGRVATTVMVLIGLAWIPVIQGRPRLVRLFAGGASVPGAADLRGLLLGHLLETAERPGCLAALIVGFRHGLVPLGRRHPAQADHGLQYTPNSFLWIVNNMFFQYYSILILLVSAAAMIGVSYATREPDYQKISGLTYGTTTDEDRRETRSSWNAGDVLASAAILVAILAAYLYFRG
jgi:solute:Na+ symporter, SSS family